MKNKIIMCVLAVTTSSLAIREQPAIAATGTANLPVQVVVAANCTIGTTAVAFPNYDPIVTHASSPDDSTAGAVTITCTKGTTTTIGLGLGGNASSSVRRMKDGGTNYIAYELYSDSGRTTVWGNSGGALYTPAAAPSFDARAFTVYGRIAAAQDVPVGTYTDTVVATVNF